jgi:DNA-binding LacI/PurR family transcriptional regulator
VRATRYNNVSERARGYWAALEEAGIAAEDVPVGALQNGAPNIVEVMSMLWDGQRARPTAFLAMSDYVALAAMEWLGARGVAVPEEVSVGGFDGVPEAAKSQPPLTTVEQPYRQIAERSVAAILDGAMPAGREVVPLTLVVRGSSGPPPIG